MEKIAIIVAAGSGSRMGSATPKQFLSIAGKPILYYTLQAFFQAFEDIQIILVLPEAYLAFGQKLIEELPERSRIQLTSGGTTRFKSVQNGLAFIKEPAIVFVHDGVRCLITPTLIRRCYTQALDSGSAIPAITATDSLRTLNESGNQLLDRTKVRIIQTPQTFRSDILKKAFAQPYQEIFTDEASVVEADGESVALIEGETDNLKITRAIDLRLAEILLEERGHLNAAE